MKANTTTSYPGSNASIQEILLLADEYRCAAQTLLLNRRKGFPLSRAPLGLCTIQAIELYLNAFLLSLGQKPERVRSYRHDLAEISLLVLDGGLKLRKKTAEHLVKMAQDREYLISRYGPEMSSSLSQINRLSATLDEVAMKVRESVIDPNA